MAREIVGKGSNTLGHAISVSPDGVGVSETIRARPLMWDEERVFVPPIPAMEERVTVNTDTSIHVEIMPRVNASTVMKPVPSIPRDQRVNLISTIHLRASSPHRVFGGVVEV